MKITELERKVIQAYKEDDHVSDFGFDDPQAAAWVKDFKSDCGIPGRQFAGVMSSLEQKGLIRTNGDSFSLTTKGVEIAGQI